MSVAFGAAGFTKCLFSLRKRRGFIYVFFLPIKPLVRVSALSCHVDVFGLNDWSGNRESKGDIRAEHGFPSKQI